MDLFTAKLTDQNAKRLDLAGGKAARLGELKALGLEVPDGFVILTAAYREFVSNNGLQPRIESILAEASVDDVKGLEKASSSIARIFADAQMPSDVADEIVTRYRELGEPAVAVRSSATAEDLPGASYAGQYDTYLNVIGADDLLAKVISCWASLWNAGAVSYRLASGMSQKEGDLEMACVVQELVEAEKSGVMFTANPMDGNAGQVVINACFGLGEGFVSGELACDHLVLDKDSATLIEERIGTKSLQIVPDAHGRGTKKVSIKEDERNSGCLSTEELFALLEAARVIEGHYASPQDIEWAFGADTLYILQSRDVTALGKREQPQEEADQWVSEFDTRVDPRYPYYATANVKEICPGAMTPLTLSDLIRGMDDGFRAVNTRFRLMGDIEPDTEYAFLGVFYNHVFLNISVFTDIVTKLPAFGSDELTRTYPSDAHELLEKKFRPTPRALLRLPIVGGSIGADAILMLRASRRFTLECDEKFPSDVSDLESMGNASVVHWIDTAIGLRDRMSVTHIALTQFAVLSYHVLCRLSERWIGAQQAVAPKVVSSIGELTGAMPMMDIWDISRLVKANPDLRAVFAENPAGRIPDAVNEIPPEESKRFAESIGRFMERFGHRSVFELEAMSPSWEEDPAYIYSMIQNYLGADEDMSPSAIWSRQELEREETIRACLRELGPIRGLMFKGLIRLTQTYIERREHMKGLLMEAVSETKKGFRILSRRFAAEGIIDDTSDLYFLTLQEVKRLAAGSGRDMQVRETVQRRKAEYRRNSTVELPEVSRGKPKPLTFEEMGPCDRPDVLEGLAVSPGKYTGKARVITDLTAAVHIEMGEVLVAPLTDAAWTPLFVPAGAIVVDLGGPLSHGSIVAREYGIPGVINVGVGTKVIEDGQVITVDGTNGRVYLHQGS